MDPIIGAAAIGGLANLVGGERANRQNVKSAREATAATERMSERSLAHQLYMSNTSYQRAMADMKAAGINPMLAFSQGGASTGSGSSGSGIASKYENSLGTAANSAMEMRRLGADLQKIQADTRLSESMKKSQDADVILKGASTAKTLQEAKKLGFDTSSAEFNTLPKRMFLGATDFLRDAASSAKLVPRTTNDEYRKAHPKAKFLPFGVRVHKKGE